MEKKKEKEKATDIMTLHPLALFNINKHIYYQ